MSKMDKFGLGKALNDIEDKNTSYLTANVPVYARLDGKNFSKFTRDMQKPYDQKFSDIMIDTMKKLVKNMNATMGYTQSDEISLYWENSTNIQNEMMFGGKKEKMIGELSGLATAYFISQIMKHFPDKVDSLPRFDCRIFNCSKDDAGDFFRWRQIDATKNSISVMASTYLNAKSLNSISCYDRRTMLRDINKPWEAMPQSFKSGVFASRFIRKSKINAFSPYDGIYMEERNVILPYTRNITGIPVGRDVFDFHENEISEILS